MVVKTESFEGIITSANAPNMSSNDFWHIPGALSAYEFASGLRLISPIPNTGEVLVDDYSQGSADSWPLGLNGAIILASNVLDGTAFIGAPVPKGAIGFGFGTKVYKVGAYVDAGGPADHVAAYDAKGKLITAASIASVFVSDWGTNYIQVVSKKPIAKLVFHGDFVVVDDLSFDTTKPDVIKGDRHGGPVKGSNSDDLIIGGKAGDNVKAKDGDDTIYGKAGNDKIHGGGGNDTIFGGKDADKLWGDKGQDSFVFDTVATKDILKDFDPAEDTIVLTHAAFAALAFGAVSDGNFHVGSAAADADDFLIYNSANGRLLYDQDGNGPAEAVAVAKLPAHLDLTSADFFVA